MTDPGTVTPAPHVHALMACGALADDGSWVSPKRSPTFLFPVHALSRVFKGKFIAALQEARGNGQLPRDPATPAQQQRLAALQRHPWVMYAKTPLAGPAQVLDYLARYTHRVAVSNERIDAVEAGGVCATTSAAARPRCASTGWSSSAASWAMWCRAASSGCGTTACWHRGTRPSG